MLHGPRLAALLLLAACRPTPTPPPVGDPPGPLYGIAAPQRLVKRCPVPLPPGTPARLPVVDLSREVDPRFAPARDDKLPARMRVNHIAWSARHRLLGAVERDWPQRDRFAFSWGAEGGDPSSVMT